VNEYFVKIWVKVETEDEREAKRKATCMLETDYLYGWITDYKVLDVIEEDKITAEWER